MTWQLWKIFARSLESPKIGTLTGSIYGRKCMSLRFAGELCVMAMKNDVKFEEELTCQFKIDINNLTNFDQSTQKSLKILL